MADVLAFDRGVKLLRGLSAETLRLGRLRELKRLQDLGLVGVLPPRPAPPWAGPPAAA